MNLLRLISINTPSGDFHIIIDQDDIARASGFGASEHLIEHLHISFQGVEIESVSRHPYQQLVEEYYKGDSTALVGIPHSQDGTDFQKNVWEAISGIPYGQTVSYKTLAEMSGKPAAIRAAGTICGLNRLILLVPCHRVLKSDGGIGSYLYGSVIKESLLLREKNSMVQ